MRQLRKQLKSNFLIGAVKLKDGLFIGDEYSIKVY